jgi:hypothetical protein
MPSLMNIISIPAELDWVGLLEKMAESEAVNAVSSTEILFFKLLNDYA